MGEALLVWGLVEDPRYAEEVEASVPAGTLEWRGFQPTDSLQKELGGCRALLNTPKWNEAYGNVVMEAMACGLPCVVSDIASNQELIQHEQNGLVFPVGNTTRLAKILLQCLNDQQCRRQLGQAAKETISQDYNVTSLVRRHQDLYQRLLEDLPRGSASHTEDR